MDDSGTEEAFRNALKNGSRLTIGGDRLELLDAAGTRLAAIEFAAGGQLTARIDCNRGRGTWTSSGSSHIEFGPLALTRAQFLALKVDGGIYEFEPSRAPK